MGKKTKKKKKRARIEELVIIASRISTFRRRVTKGFRLKHEILSILEARYYSEEKMSSLSITLLCFKCCNQRSTQRRQRKLGRGKKR